MTAMTDLIAELAEVVRMSADDDQDSMIGAGYAVRFIRAHHAEIEAMARDAKRYREFCRQAELNQFPAEILNDAFELGSGALGMHFDGAMHDSAREGSNG